MKMVMARKRRRKARAHDELSKHVSMYVDVLADISWTGVVGYQALSDCRGAYVGHRLLGNFPGVSDFAAVPKLIYYSLLSIFQNKV
jgi:hypothetical protein